jgi:HPt (histidine-containing phosphotransfer) domain-containing protein
MVDSSADKPAAIRLAITDHDLQALGRLAHGLKGVAGNLMAHELANLAARTESAATRQEKDALELGAALADMLDRALSEIRDGQAAH